MNRGRDERVPELENMLESLKYLPCGRNIWWSNVEDLGKRMKIAKAIDSMKALKETTITRNVWLNKCTTEKHALLDRERTRTQSSKH